MRSTLRLYTVSHKPFFMPAHEYLRRVWVGNNKQVYDSRDLSDDSGENISNLNEFFCELTVLYWVWKNVPAHPGDYWGLCHYRRFFTDKGRPFSFSTFPLNREATEKEMLHYVHASLDNTICHKLKNKDVLLTYPVNVSLKRKVVRTIYEQYLLEHSKEEWELLQSVMEEKYPAYIPSFIELAQQTKMCIGNMMIARPEIWNNYLPWLFDILMEVHTRMKYTGDTYQRRAVAFIAERLMNLYVQHNRLSTAYMQLVVFDK